MVKKSPKSRAEPSPLLKSPDLVRQAPISPVEPPPSNDKETAYYSNLVQGWILTRMEKDKSLLTLSSFGIGLVGTILTTVGVNSICQLVLYALIILSFLTSIISSILIFGKNADHLADEIQNCPAENGSPNKDKYLTLLDRIMFASFVFGLIIFLLVGILSSYSKLKVEVKKNEQQIQNSQ